jgi:endonuclease III
MKNKSTFIKKVNELLMKRYGIPQREEPLPNPLDVLIATILSQNTNDNNSFKAFQNLKLRFKSWSEAAYANRSEIEKLIRVGGLAPQKSKAIKEVLTKLKAGESGLSLDHLENLSEQKAIEELTKFNGVGVKTAACVLIFGMNKNVCPVDTHVHRTVNRIGIVNEKTPDKTFWKLNENFPDRIAHSFHTNLIMLGRGICKPTNQNCSVCPLIKICKFPAKNLETKRTGKRNTFLLLDNIGKGRMQN